MISILGRYLFLFVLTIFILIGLSLALAHVFPGELIANLSGVVPSDEAQRSALIEKWATDKNLFLQYINYCQLVFSGEWGVSSVSGSVLLDDIKRTVPATIELSLYSMLVATFVGIPSGCIAGIKAYSKTDSSINAYSIMQYSVPVFWFAIALILVFCLQFNFFPLSGRLSLMFNIPHQTGFVFIDILLSEEANKRLALSNAFSHLVLPSLAVGLVSGAALTRLVRRSVIDVLNKPYIASARSRGLSFQKIFFSHVLHNALLPILPLASIQLTTLITNAMIIEVLFSWPGIGRFLLEAIYQQDYSALRVGMLVVASIVILLTVLVDMVNRLIDPKKSGGQNVAL